ncbi:hypothetical protein CPC08DRAFT_34340 [Agrocybe pediades]|nr:hypothetical protein CPC08DRAFT_34340 [Agrocybe pediades]
MGHDILSRVFWGRQAVSSSYFCRSESLSHFNSYVVIRRHIFWLATTLSLPPSSCVLVASHIGDLRGAAKQGMSTIYIRRPDEPDEQLDEDTYSGWETWTLGSGPSQKAASLTSSLTLS